MIELEEGNKLEITAVSKDGKRVRIEITNANEHVMIRPSYRAESVSGRIYPRSALIRWAIVPVGVNEKEKNP